MDGRKHTGGRIEVKVRMREPLNGQDLQTSTERWLVLDQSQVTPPLPGPDYISGVGNAAPGSGVKTVLFFCDVSQRRIRVCLLSELLSIDAVAFCFCSTGSSLDVAARLTTPSKVRHYFQPSSCYLERNTRSKAYLHSVSEHRKSPTPPVLCYSRAV